MVNISTPYIYLNSPYIINKLSGFLKNKKKTVKEKIFSLRIPGYFHISLDLLWIVAKYMHIWVSWVSIKYLKDLYFIIRLYDLCIISYYYMINTRKAWYYVVKQY